MGLWKFIILSIALHIILIACFTIVPYVVKKYRVEKRVQAERMAREEARRKAEEDAKKAAEEIAKAKVEEALKQDAHDLLIDSMDEAQFEEVWADVLSRMSANIKIFLDELKDKKFDISPEDLGSSIEELRGQVLEELLTLENLQEISKKEIAMCILETTSQSIPEFNQQVQASLKKQGTNAKTSLDKVVKDESNRRETARKSAIKQLDNADKEIKLAKASSAQVSNAIPKINQEIDKHKAAVAKADKALKSAINTLRKAATDTRNLQNIATKIKAQPGNVPTPEKSSSPEVIKTAKDAVKAVAQAGKTKNDLRKQAQQAHDHAVKAVSRAEATIKQGSQKIKAANKDKIQKDLTSAATEVKKQTAALKKVTDALAKNDSHASARDAEAAKKDIAALTKKLETQIAAAKKTAGESQDQPLKQALTESANVLSSAVTDLKVVQEKSQQTAELSKKAAEAEKKEAEALAKSQVNILKSTHSDIAKSTGTAKQTLQQTANDANVKEDPVCKKVLSKALEQTDKTISPVIPKLAKAANAKDTVAVLKDSKETLQKLDQLMSYLEECRKDIGVTANKMTDEALAQVKTAQKSASNIDGALKKADKYLVDAAHQADVAVKKNISKSIHQNVKDLRKVTQTSVAETGKILKESATPAGSADARKKEKLNKALKYSSDTDKQLTRLAQEISARKKSLNETAKRFADKAAKAVQKSVSRDSKERKDAEQFLEDTMKEQVAEQFRTRTEKLAVNVLKRQEIPQDDEFVKALGQEAVNILLVGSLDTLKTNSFNSLMEKSASAYGAVLNKDAAATKTDDPELDQKISHQITDTAKSGVKNALTTSQRALQLPFLEQFASQSGLKMRIQNASDHMGRQRGSGEKDRTMIDLNLYMSRIKTALLKGRGYHSWIYDLEKYRKSIEEVIEGRELDESILKAPSLDSAKTDAERKTQGMRNAFILISETKEDYIGETDTKENGKRSLDKPRFKSFAYGGAPLAVNEPVIDGDLSDWKDVEEFALRGQLVRSKKLKQAPKKFDNNRYLYVQWNQKGFYIAYRMVDDRDITKYSTGRFWDNDSLELFFDFANKRSETRTKDAQQLWFWPLGSAMAEDIIGGEAVIFVTGKSLYRNYKPCFRRSDSPSQPKMGVKRIKEPKGYHVELFLPAAVFAKPDLRPGRIIAFNFSNNNGENYYFRWSTNLGKCISYAPILWGDLLLLGTDAEITFVRPRTEDPLTAIIPGEPIGVRVKDADMNLDTEKKDKIKIAFNAQNGDIIIGYMEEIGKDTGIFEGSVDTELFLLHDKDRIRDDILQVAGGEVIEVVYMDQARRYGERNYEAKAKLPVGLPVLSISSK